MKNLEPKMSLAYQIKGSELPPALLRKFNFTSEDYLIIKKEEHVDYDDDGKPMPPESQISDELIKAVEASEKDYKEGRFKRFNNVDEMFEELDKD